MPGTCKPGATELVGFFQLGWTWCFVFVITLGVTYSLASRSPAQPHLEFLRHLLLTKLPALAWRVSHTSEETVPAFSPKQLPLSWMVLRDRLTLRMLRQTSQAVCPAELTVCPSRAGY